MKLNECSLTRLLFVGGPIWEASFMYSSIVARNEGGGCQKKSMHTNSLKLSEFLVFKLCKITHKNKN